MNSQFRDAFRGISLATMLVLSQLVPAFSCQQAAAQNEFQGEIQSESRPLHQGPKKVESQSPNPSEPAPMSKPIIVDPEPLMEVTIPSVAGRVQWSDVATAVGDQLKLDPDALRQMMPSGSLDLGSPSVMLSLIAINLAAGDAVSFAIGSDERGGQALKVRCRRSFFTGKTNSPASSHAKTQAVVDLDSDWAQRSTGKPLVVFFHGMNSGPGTFDVIRSEIRKQGLATASVGYDYRQAIVDSASQAMTSLKTALGADGRSPDLCLVGHSMGGLVAREMTESVNANPATLDPKRIKQLITIGTPHQGSNWASLPPMSDMFTSDGMDTDDMIGLILHRPSSRGIQDLIPGSEFLTALNQRPRRQDVRYTAIIGTASPIDELQASTLRQTLQSLDQQGSVVRLIRPRIRPLLESFEELTAGKGDGMVSVTSARIPGINDHVEVPVSHFDMIQPQHSNARASVLQVLCDRLN